MKSSSGGGLHFLDKCGVRIGEDNAVYSSHGAPRIEEVDSEVCIVTLLTLTDVLMVEREGRTYTTYTKPSTVHTR